MKYLANVVTLRIDSEKCTGCGLCVQVCPRRVLVINSKKAITQERDNCIECGACQTNCSFDAISVDRGTGCATAFLTAKIYGGPPRCDCSGPTGCC